MPIAKVKGKISLKRMHKKQEMDYVPQNMNFFFLAPFFELQLLSQQITKKVAKAQTPDFDLFLFTKAMKGL